MFDEEFEAPTRLFFDQARSGRFQLVTSALVEAEIELAPAQVRDFFNTLLEFAEVVGISEGTLRLQRAYLEARILSEQWVGDALHVALATSSGCAVAVSWNFKHLVHYQKIQLYNEVNRANGYPELAIHSPREVIVYEDENI